MTCIFWFVISGISVGAASSAFARNRSFVDAILAFFIWPADLGIMIEDAGYRLMKRKTEEMRNDGASK